MSDDEDIYRDVIESSRGGGGWIINGERNNKNTREKEIIQLNQDELIV